MAKSLILVRLTLGWEDVGVAREYVDDMRKALEGMEGFAGAGAWRGVQDPQSQLVAFAFDSPEATRRALASVGDLPLLIERQHAGAAPSDVMGVTSHRADGPFVRALPDGSLLSFSVRTSDPGYGSDLVEDYEGVFAGLAMMPGYAGSCIGVNSQMPDQVVGLVAWKSEAAFSASMPEQTLYEVLLYEPLGEA